MLTKICDPFRSNFIGFELSVGFSNSLQSSGSVFLIKFLREMFGELLYLTPSLELYFYNLISPYGISFWFFGVSTTFIVSIIDDLKFYSCSSYYSYALDFIKFGVIDLIFRLCSKLWCWRFLVSVKWIDNYFKLPKRLILLSLWSLRDGSVCTGVLGGSGGLKCLNTVTLGIPLPGRDTSFKTM